MTAPDACEASTWAAMASAESVPCRRRAALLAQHLCRPCSAATGGDDETGTSTVSCGCGKVELVFHVKQPLNRIPCCCWDCRQKCLWAENEGGPQLPDAVKEFKDAMDLIYFPAAFEMYDTLPDLHPKGLDALQFNTLRQDDGGTDRPGWRGDRGSINMVATCCMTVLAVDNVNYHTSKDMDVDDGQQMLIFPAVTNVLTEMIPISSSLNFVEDFPELFVPALKERMAKLVRSGAAVENRLRPQRPVLEVPENCTTFTQLRLAKGTPTIDLRLEPGTDPWDEHDDDPLTVD